MAAAASAAPAHEAEADDSELLAGILRGVLRGKRAVVKGAGQHSKAVAKGTRGVPNQAGRSIAKGAAQRSSAATKSGARQGAKAIQGPNRVVAKVADRLDNTVAALEAVTNAEAVPARRSWLSRAVATVKHAAPSFLREAILGSALFGVYESASDTFTSAVLSEGADADGAVALGVVPLAAGWSGGLIYGTLQNTVDSGLLWRQGLAPTPPTQWVSFAARTSAVTYGATFLTYEVAKYVLTEQTENQPPESPVGLACVATAGAAAGVVNTIADTKTGLQGPLNSRALYRAAPTGAITFVAFEFGKHIIEDMSPGNLEYID